MAAGEDFDLSGAGGAAVREAFRLWSRSIFGAPMRLEEQITGAAAREETVVRVLTSVARRELFEQRLPAEHGAQGTAAVDARNIDPFAVSLEELRARTARVDACVACYGTARVSCPACAGSGRQRCAGCGGSGHIMRYYKKSSRLIQCPDCRAQGTVSCSTCARAGTVVCGACSGSGRQLVWWAWKETTHRTVRFSAESPALLAHPILREDRPLRASDVTAFTTNVGVECDGVIPEGPLAPADAAWRAQLTPHATAPYERILYQQYLRLSIPCCDVSFEMCGAKGTVVLSGAHLIGARTPDALWPIRRRLRWWPVAGILLCLFGAWFSGALHNPTAYFRDVNDVIDGLLFVSATAAIVAAGGLLRGWRPGFRRWPMRNLERAALAVTVVSLALVPTVLFAARPTTAEARAAIARGDLANARLVTDALVATHPSGEVMALLDELELTETRALSGDALLAKLDGVASRGGARAQEAAALARRRRLDDARAALVAHQPTAALARLDHASLSRDVDAAELRASAVDAQRDACSDEACRYDASRSALALHATPARAAAAAASKARLLQALAARDRREDTLDDVRALRALATLSRRASEIRDDTEIAEAARATSAWVESQRAAIALLDAPIAAVDDILERPPNSASGTGWPDLAGVAVFAADEGGRCKGLYAIGAVPGAREIAPRVAGAQRLLAQATGHPDARIVPRRTSARVDETSTWREGRARVVARWHGESLVELRIGEVTP